ncbi:MAG TPA: DUF2147 domain-containing protein [Chitinophagaceae bacterium]|nr:DUF2147 domain-containing protein [Chitinophagaceae bacterium]
MKYKFFIWFILLWLVNKNIIAQVRPDDIIGVWLTPGKEPAKIQIYKSGEKYYGKIVWLKYPYESGKPKLDRNNPDKAIRIHPIVGLIILKEFRLDGNDEWEDGKIYDPESGKTYSCYLSLKDKNTLKVRGYVAISLFGRTEIWTKTTL